MSEILLDKDIREPLFLYLEELYGKIRIFEEKMIGSSRADCVMVTETGLFGIEIKSDADTYARLTSQIKDYDLYYDYNYIVVGSKHAIHIEEHVPDYWGILSVEVIDGQVDFYQIREPKENPKCDLFCKLSILWRMELKQIQELHQMPKYEAKSKEFVRNAIRLRTDYPKEKKGYIDKELLKKEICEILFERDYTTIQNKINEYRKKKGKRAKSANRSKKSSIKRVQRVVKKI